LGKSLTVLISYVGAIREGEKCPVNSQVKGCFLDPFLFVPSHIFFVDHDYWTRRAQEKGIRVPIMVHANGIQTPRKKEYLLSRTGFWKLYQDFNCTLNLAPLPLN
jgi:hypothetical protein